MLVPSTAAARDSKHRNDAGKRNHHTEFRMDKHQNGRMSYMGHRHNVGTRFTHRPIHGRFVNINRERLWLADGILYREMRTPHGIVYIVVGYLK